MTPSDLALARHHSYTLVGRLFLEGVQPDLLPFVRALPALSTALPEPWSADEAAAQHQHLWGFNVFPFESVFLGESGLLGGAATERVRDYYQHAGYRPTPSAASVDHVGEELRFLAFLCGAEADAWEDGLETTARALQQRQRDWLERHLLRWLPPLGQAVLRQQQSFPRALVELTWEVVQGHAEEVAVAAVPWSLPAPPNLLADRGTGLREIATFLITPPHSGLFLSRDDIGALARRHELPRGFGSRQQMLVNLMRAAAQYDRLPALLASLSDLFATDQAALERQGAHRLLEPFVRPWHERLTEGRTVLQHLQARAEPLPDD